MYGFIIPAKGRELIASLLAGDTLTITRCMVGEGKPQEEVEPSELTDLVNPIAQATSTAPIVTRQQVDMTVEYRNDLNGGLSRGFYLSEFGVFARGKTGEEVMIYYGCLGEYPQYVQPYTDGGAIEVRRFPISIGVSNTSDVHLDYNADAFLTSENLVQYCQTVVLPLFLEEVKKLIAEHSISQRCARFVVGTSTAGWTAKDVDYLCDGTDDQAEINAAIQALPSSGGEIVILDGTYNITADINVNRANTKLSGNGTATVLKAMASNVKIINVTADSCTISDLMFDSKTANIHVIACIYLYNVSKSLVYNNSCIGSAYPIYCQGNYNRLLGNLCKFASSSGYAIYCRGSKNVIVGNNCCDNLSTGLFFAGESNTVSNNVCSNNDLGIYANDASYSTIAGNACVNNNRGMLLYLEKSLVTGNTCIRGTGQSSDYTALQYTINLTSISKDNLVTGNNCMGKAPINSGSNNTITNNKY